MRHFSLSFSLFSLYHGRSLILFVIKLLKCPSWDLNPNALYGHRILNPARLPVPPLGLALLSIPAIRMLGVDDILSTIHEPERFLPGDHGFLADLAETHQTLPAPDSSLEGFPNLTMKSTHMTPPVC